MTEAAAARDLEAAGVERRRAEAPAEALRRAAAAERAERATKADLAAREGRVYRALWIQGGGHRRHPGRVHRVRRRRPLGRLLLLAALVALVPATAMRAEVRNPHGVAVVIGNRDYEHRDVPDVTFAHRDADGFRRYVVEVLGYDPENVIDLRDATRRQLFDALGTRSDPRSLLWSYLDPDGGSDVVVFYSGHGVPGVNDGRGYLLPVDADPKAAQDDGYPIDLLYRNVGGLAEARSVRVYLDACFSGGSHQGGLIRNASPVYVEASLPAEVGDKVTSLTAASGKQVASWDEAAGHGMFTHHLLDALYGGGDADEDGQVTAAEAKAYLDRHMTRAARRQHRRVQQASLVGMEDVVLASVGSAGGGFPPRPDFDEGSEGTKGARGIEDKVVPPPPPPPPVETAEAVETALGLSHAQRVLVQRGLSSLGHDVGMADGVFGRRTRTGIEAYQRGKGLPETGHLTAELSAGLQALGKAAEAEARRREEAKRLEAQEAEEARRARLRPGSVIRDCEGCPELVVVPSGSFLMGSPSGESGRYDNEGPVHRVTISRAFAVGVYEVTFGEWDACVSGGGCGGYRPDDEGWGRGHRPVINVSWVDAKAYVRWLSRETGEEYRLLSESEWEYVARGGATGPYHYGSSLTSSRANYGRNNGGTVRVGRYVPNGFGLHDVHGNVWEWVEDCWHGDYVGAPRDGSAWTVGGDCERRVLRGGSWLNSPRGLRSAIRNWYTTGLRLSDDGFRVARTLD